MFCDIFGRIFGIDLNFAGDRRRSGFDAVAEKQISGIMNMIFMTIMIGISRGMILVRWIAYGTAFAVFIIMVVMVIMMMVIMMIMIALCVVMVVVMIVIAMSVMMVVVMVVIALCVMMMVVMIVITAGVVMVVVVVMIVITVGVVMMVAMIVWPVLQTIRRCWLLLPLRILLLFTHDKNASHML